MRDTLVGVVIVDQPDTVRECLESLVSSDEQNRMQIVLVDNGSDAATKAVIASYADHVAQVIVNEWNVGPIFGTNQWLTLHQPGQNCVQIDQNCVIHSRNWLRILSEVIADPALAMAAARRPTFWLDRGKEGTTEYRDSIMEDKCGGHFCETLKAGYLHGPLTMYKDKLVKHLGFLNEASMWGAIDYTARVSCTGLKDVYVPEVFISELSFEQHTHPTYKAHQELVYIRERMHNIFVERYKKEVAVTWGSRFLPESMKDDYYSDMSDTNWEFMRDYK